MIGFVYKHRNIINNKVYIGRTIQTIRNRVKQGYRNTLFGNAVDKYGWYNFETSILHSAAANTALELITLLNTVEEQQIKLHNSNNRDFGYNIRSGGEFGHFRHTPEAIEKIRQTSKRPNSGQFQTGQASPRKGTKQPQTEQQKRNTSIAMKKWHAERRLAK